MRETRRGKHGARRRGAVSALFAGLSWWQVVLVVVPLTLAGVGGFALRSTFASSPSSSSAQAAAAAAAKRTSSCTFTGSAKPAIPLPSRPAGVDPVTVPAHSGSTSAHAIEVSFRSASGDSVGDGQSADYTGADVDFSGIGGSVRISAGPWLIELGSQHGEKLVCGTYPGASRESFGATPDMDISGNGAGCNRDTGTFTIYQVAYTPKSNVITRLNATFSQICDASTGPLIGLIRYNATSRPRSRACRPAPSRSPLPRTPAPPRRIPTSSLC